MSLILRAKATRIFGLSRRFSTPVVTRGGTFTVPTPHISTALLAKVRQLITAGELEVVTADPAHGLAVTRSISARNQLHIRLGLDQGSGLLLPNGATLHLLTLGGVEFTFGDSNIDGSSTSSLLSNFLAALAASSAFQATGAVVRVSQELALPAAVAASCVLTSNNTNVSDGHTVTIGTKTYTFRASLTPTEGEVLIGANADASLLNLIRAINHTGTPDTDYKCAAVHPTVSAGSAVSAHTITVTAKTVGSAGNAIASTETSATLSWASATLTGGSDTQALIIIDGEAVPDWGAFEDATSLTDENGDDLATAYLDLTFFNSSANEALNTDSVIYATRTVTSGDVSRGYIAFDTGLTDLSTKFAVRITRSGTELEHDGTVEVRSNRSVVIQNNNSVDFEAGDVVQLFAAGTE